MAASTMMDETYGAMFIGLLFATFFQGVLSMQAYHYYENFPRDPLTTRLLVAAVWILDLIHLVLISDATYHYLVTDWGDQVALSFSTLPLDMHLVLIGLASIFCQGFFLHRIWVLSNHNMLVIATLALGCLSTFVLDVLTSIQIGSNLSVTTFAKHTKEVIAMFVIGAGVDLAIALVVCAYLNRGKTGFQRTDSMISKVIHYVVGSGLVTSLLAVACLVAYLIKPNTFIFIAMHFSLGRMYTNALLATLNARTRLRSDLSAPHAGHIDLKYSKEQGIDILVSQRVDVTVEDTLVDSKLPSQVYKLGDKYPA